MNMKPCKRHGAFTCDCEPIVTEYRVSCRVDRAIGNKKGFVTRNLTPDTNLAVFDTFEEAENYCNDLINLP